MSREARESKGGAWPSSPSSVAERLTAIFAKQPIPGEVKTRLGPVLSQDAAAELARAMLLDVAERLGGAADFSSVLCFWPPEAEPWFRREVPWIPELRTQRGAGLAERLESFFGDTLDPPGAQAPARTAVVVGSDQPWLSPERVLGAHLRLEAGADLVLGPDAGGGYDLIGLRRPAPRLFRDVPMSTDDMCEATLSLAGELGLACELLEPAYDIDVPDDLERLVRDLRSHRGSAAVPERTRAVLVELGLLSKHDSTG